MSDAGNDPLRKAALVTDIVQSISVIPDAITRSVYTRECAKQMEIDEQVLLREIALKRVERSAGSEAKEIWSGGRRSCADGNRPRPLRRCKSRSCLAAAPKNWNAN